MISSFRTTAVTVGVVYVVVAAISVIAIDLRIVLIPAACASLALTLGGLIVFRRLRGALALPVPAREDHAELEHPIVIEGTPLAFQGYDQELIVAVGVQHLVELRTCTVLAGLAFYLMAFSPLVGRSSSELEIGGYEAELICGAGLAVLLVSVRWFQERWRLRSSAYAIGYLSRWIQDFFVVVSPTNSSLPRGKDAGDMARCGDVRTTTLCSSYTIQRIRIPTLHTEVLCFTSSPWP